MLRVPAEGAEFDWRISVAAIDQPGPFSDFSGYERTMVLLAGGGVRLRCVGAPDMLLREAGDLIRFDGALAVHCDLLEGSCADLNLMVAKRLGPAYARIEAASRRPQVRVDPAKTAVVFCVSGGAALSSADRATELLGPWDTALIDAADGEVRIAPAAPAADASVFIAEVPGPFRAGPFRAGPSGPGP